MGKRKTLIAVVDDEESVRKALARLIRAVGFEVEIYCSGEEFLSSLGERRRPHCAVLDLRMPRMSGLDVQRALLLADAQVPVVMMTGDDSSEGQERALQQGAKAYLSKPVDEIGLLDAIQAALRAH